MEQQWPPSPTNTARVVMIRLLLMEIGEDRLLATQPRAVQIQKRIHGLLTAAIVLALAFVALPIILGIAIVSIPGFPAAPVRALTPLVTIQPYARMLLWPLIGAQAIFALLAALNPTKPFVLRRNPNTLQIGRTARFALPESAQFVVAHQSRRASRSPIYVLRLEIPGPENRNAPTFGLATFVTQADAERAKAEIERFLQG
ncbi:MAG: hypothetical protein ABIY70_03245 [Capsulimonas sp.]|uniref:hypothetical protein n=1 Tax=Capsulimonas sp. TaxID=2494211 RepID=UPI0032658B92